MDSAIAVSVGITVSSFRATNHCPVLNLLKRNMRLRKNKKFYKLNEFEQSKVEKLIRIEQIFKHQIKNLDKLEYEGFVYVIGNFKYKFVKIGFSLDPYTRIKSIQTGCPFQVSVILILNASNKYEKRLHSKFRRYNTVGEWFRFKGRLEHWISLKLNTLYIQMGESPNKNNFKKPRPKTISIYRKPHDLDVEFNSMFSKWG